MALPAGMQTFTLTFGAAGVLGIDEQLRMEVTFTAATSALWAATGQPFLLKPQLATAELGGSGSATLISPDQDGFTNGSGQGIRNWTYLARVRYLDAGGTQIATVDKVFAYLTSMGPVVDLDTTVPVSTSAGVVVDVPAGPASDESIAGLVSDPDSDTSAAILALVGSGGSGGSGITGIDNGDGTISFYGSSPGGATVTQLTTDTGDVLTTDTGDIIAAA